MIIEEKIENLITPTLKDLGYDIVQIALHGQNKTRNVLEILIEKSDGQGVNIDDCSKASQAISVLLDVEDPLKQSYILQVSSAGIDRPLIHFKDFQRFIGRMVKIETKDLINDQHHFKGSIENAENDMITLQPTDKKETLTIPFHLITKAKLLLPDDLLKKRKEKND